MSTKSTSTMLLWYIVILATSFLLPGCQKKRIKETRPAKITPSEEKEQEESENEDQTPSLAKLEIDPVSSYVKRGEALSLTIRAYDHQNQVLTSYTGSIVIQIMDLNSTLQPSVEFPATYTFKAGDQGIATLNGSFKFDSYGHYKIIVQSKELANIQDDVSLYVVQENKLAVGKYSACLVQKQGLKCWGRSRFGQLGNGVNDTQHLGDDLAEVGNIPFVDLPKPVISVAIGHYHTCALADDLSLFCWGFNANGHLGLGDTNDRGDTPGEMGAALQPVNLGSERKALKVVLGSNHTCALLDNGTIKCWGNNPSGQLGYGHANDIGDQPNEMGDNLPAIDFGSAPAAIDIASGKETNCALFANQKLKCWGYGGYGSLGNGTATLKIGDDPNEMGDNLKYVDLGTNVLVKRIAVSSKVSCAISTEGKIKCWGSDTAGGLAIGNSNPALIIGDEASEMGDALAYSLMPSNLKALEIYGTHGEDASFCVLFSDKTVRCWGNNNVGQLGLGDTSPRGDDISELGDSLLAVDYGDTAGLAELNHDAIGTCVLTLDDKLKCWGTSSYGFLVTGNNTDIFGDQPGEMGNNLPFVNLP